MLFDQKMRKPIHTLAANLQECGYTAIESTDENCVLDIQKDGHFIGSYGLNGSVQLMEHSAGEREKLQNILDYTIAFMDCAPAYKGHKTLSEYELTTMTVDINPETGKPVYFVYQADDGINTKEDFAPYSYSILEDAKAVYTQRAGLFSPDIQARRLEETISAKYVEILQENGYRLKHSTDDDKSWGLFKGDKVVGHIDKSFNVVVTAKDKLIETNMSNLRDQAKWEVAQAGDGQSVFTKKFADALIRLGYNVQNVWQKFQMQMGIFHGGKQVATVNSNDQITFQPHTPTKVKQKIENVQKNVRRDI